MKRSEMIDLMLKTERECQEYKCGKAFMETLLNKLEEAGMLPPSCEGDKYTEWDEEDE